MDNISKEPRVAGVPGIPNKDRLQVYPANRHYFQYKSEPIMLIGANQGWTLSMQHLDYDFVQEFEMLHQAGGNVVRIASFITPEAGGKDANDPTRNNLPWRRVGRNKYRLDLENGGGNPDFWNRLDRLAGEAYTRDIIVIFELWDLYGPARPDRWPAHPFYPGNSDDLIGNDQLDTETDLLDVALTRTVTRGQAYRPKALRLLEQYVTRCLKTLAEYPNILYLVTNETSAPKQWSDYWVKFTHDYFRNSDSAGGATHVVGEMPREFNFTENFRVEDMVLDPAYDFADASQYFGQGIDSDRCKLIDEIRWSMHWGDRYRGVMVGRPEATKPITAAKIYSHTTPTPLWARMMAAAAISRYHRLHPEQKHFKNGMEIQLPFVKLLVNFLEKYQIRPWEMMPDHGRALFCKNIDGVMVMTDQVRPRYLLYVLNMSDEPQREFTLNVSEPGEYEMLWYSATTGQTIGPEMVNASACLGSQARLLIEPPRQEAFQQAAMLITKKG